MCRLAHATSYRVARWPAVPSHGRPLGVVRSSALAVGSLYYRAIAKRRVCSRQWCGLPRDTATERTRALGVVLELDPVAAGHVDVRR